jgi:cysteine desulfurase family protein (TIGR01976 family)
MTHYLFRHNANTHWAYPTSEETDRAIADARAAAAAFLNCAPREVVFGANMTTLTFHLARTLARTWQKGDEVIVSELDHHANIDSWKALEIDRGIVVRMAKLTEEAEIDWADLERLVSRRTRLVAIGGASNATGTINDLQRAKKVAAAAGALLFVDAVHLAPHELIDVQAIGCDFLACSAYKFYGPHIGLLFARETLLAELPFPKLQPAPDTAPERAETGTQNQEGIAGVTATIDFLAAIGGSGTSLRERLARTYERLHAEGERFARKLWEELSAIKGVRMYGVPPSKRRTPTVAFTVRGRTGEEVSRVLAEQGLFLSHGDFYAQTVIERFGVEALVRAGCACYTTDEEIDRLLCSVQAL